MTPRRGRFRVEGVHVADASIMPDSPSGFTHLSTPMVAERVSELIAPVV
jgi:choline dehydrogenase-like flavoprotein